VSIIGFNHMPFTIKVRWPLRESACATRSIRELAKPDTTSRERRRVACD